MHRRGGDPVVCPAGAGGAERRPADWPAVRLYAVLYADHGADQQYRLPQPANVDKTFPVVRVFGTIGWIIAGICIGVTGISDTTGIFTLAALCSVALALYSLTPPHTPAPAKGMPVQFRDLLCADAFALLKTRHFLIFSLCATLISVPLGTYYAYTASYLADAGVKDVSTAMSFGQMSRSSLCW